MARWVGRPRAVSVHWELPEGIEPRDIVHFLVRPNGKVQIKLVSGAILDTEGTPMAEARVHAEGSKTEWPKPTEQDKQESVSEALAEVREHDDREPVGSLAHKATVEYLEKRGWSYEPELAEWDLLTAVDRVLEQSGPGGLYCETQDAADAMSELKRVRKETR